MHEGAERRSLEAVLIHKHPRQVKSPFKAWLLPSQCVAPFLDGNCPLCRQIVVKKLE